MSQDRAYVQKPVQRKLAGVGIFRAGPFFAVVVSGARHPQAQPRGLSVSTRCVSAGQQFRGLGGGAARFGLRLAQVPPVGCAVLAGLLVGGGGAGPGRVGGDQSADRARLGGQSAAWRVGCGKRHFPGPRGLAACPGSNELGSVRLTRALVRNEPHGPGGGGADDVRSGAGGGRRGFRRGGVGCHFQELQLEPWQRRPWVPGRRDRSPSRST